MKVVIAQKGSRAHFSDARALSKKGVLAKLIVDWYFGHNLFSVLNSKHNGFKPLVRAFGAYSTDLQPDKIKALNFWGLGYRLHMKWAQKNNQVFNSYLKSDTHFAKTVAKQKLPPHDVFYTFSYAALEALKAAKDRGTFTVVNQIDPGFYEYELVRQETMSWPEYAMPITEIPMNYFERCKQEWEIADLVIVNSDWTKQALIQQGVSSKKIEIIPLAYENRFPIKLIDRETTSNKNKNLRVLWLGSVIIRKGIQYLVEAAKKLVDMPVEFTVAGPIDIRPEVIKKSPKNIHWVGSVPRLHTIKFYQQADIFVLPTVSDGFAITQIEALSNGLPIIVTPNCGSVVKDGENGFLIPPYSHVALAEVIKKFIKNPDMINVMKTKCFERAQDYTLDKYATALMNVFTQRIAESINLPSR